MDTTNTQKVLQQVIKQVWEDSVFKEKLIADPINTLESFTGRTLKLPEGMKIVVVDQTDASTIFMNLPAEVNMEDVELDEEQLDYVSGGGNDPNTPPVILGINNLEVDLF